MLSGAIFVKNPSGSRAMRRAAKKHNNPHRGSKHRGHGKAAAARANPKRGAHGRFLKAKSNPKAKRYVRRRNPDMAGGMLDKVMSPVQGLVRKVPFLGPRVAPLLVPITFGLVGSAGLFYGMKLVGRYVPDSVKPFAYTIGGAVLALGSAVLPIDPKSKVGLAVAFAGIGASLDLFRHYSGTSADLSGDMDEDDDMDGLVTDTAGGLMVDMDGIVTDTAGIVTDTGAMSSSAAVDSMAGAVMGNYEDATLRTTWTTRSVRPPLAVRASGPAPSARPRACFASRSAPTRGTPAAPGTASAGSTSSSAPRACSSSPRSRLRSASRSFRP